MTFEDFVSYYEKHGICLGQISKPKNKMNEKALYRRWEKFEENNNKEIKIDEKWIKVRDKVRERDKECQFLSKLKIDNFDLFEYFIVNNLESLYETLDVAHIIRRSKSKKLYYDLDNLVLLNRVSHSALDSNHCPITGVAISNEEVEQFWKFIIGKERWERLHGSL